MRPLQAHQDWISKHRPRVFYGVHLPWLDGVVRSVLGADLEYVDPASWVADELAYVLVASAKPVPAEKGKVVKLSSARYIEATG